MKFPTFYLVTASEGTECQRLGLDVSFTGTVANVTAENSDQYGKFWSVRLAWLRRHGSRS